MSTIRVNCDHGRAIGGARGTALSCSEELSVTVEVNLPKGPHPDRGLESELARQVATVVLHRYGWELRGEYTLCPEHRVTTQAPPP